MNNQMINTMNYFKILSYSMNNHSVLQKLYQNLKLSRNSSGEHAPAICNLFIPGQNIHKFWLMSVLVFEFHISYLTFLKICIWNGGSANMELV